MPYRLIDHINSFRADLLCIQVTTEKPHTANSTYKKLAVQWLNEALCFLLSTILNDFGNHTVVSAYTDTATRHSF